MNKTAIKNWLKTKSDTELERIVLELEGQRMVVKESYGPNSPEMNSINEQFDMVMGEMIHRTMKHPENITLVPTYWRLLACENGNVEQDRNFILKPKMNIPNTYYQLMALGR